MRESPDSHSQPEERIRSGHKIVRPLFDELESFLKHARSTEIFLGQWLHDDTLPLPSADFLEFFAWDLLFGIGKFERFFEAETECQQVVIRYTVNLKSMHENSRWNSIVYALGRRRIIEFSGARLHVLHWWPALTAMKKETDEIRKIKAGKRRLARFVLELMTLRAIFMREVLYLEGLSEAVNHKPFAPAKVMEIAFRMLQWHAHLAQKLGRNPAKTELKNFIQEVYSDSKETPSNWVAASKLIDLPYTDLRGKKINDDCIIQLALASRGLSPKVMRIRSWEKPPK